MNNINDTYFDGYYKQVWKSLIPGELTVKEVDFIISYFGLSRNSMVLDLMCGYGRHALALGEKGIPVLAVDNLEEYIDEIKHAVDDNGLPIQIIKEDVASFRTEKKFDLVICMGNSLNFFNAQDTQLILNNIAGFLKPGGALLINSWSIAEIAIKSFKDKSWSYCGDLKVLTDSKFLFHPTRIETESIIISSSGDTETKTGIDYIFSLGEYENMLNNAGLSLSEVYSIPGRRKFSLGEPRAYLIAKKP